MQQNRSRENVWRKRPLGRVKNKMRGDQQEMWYKIWMCVSIKNLRVTSKDCPVGLAIK